MWQIDDSSEVDDDSEDSDVGQRSRKKKRCTPTTSIRKGKLDLTRLTSISLTLE